MKIYNCCSRLFRLFLAAAFALSFAPLAEAALITRLDGQSVYDTDFNITWIANANLAAINTFGLATGVNLGTDIYGNVSVINSDGTMTWGGAQAWIGAMNAADYLGFNDWRLPITNTSCGTFNCTSSEMSHLYYVELGNLGLFGPTGDFQTAYGLLNKGPFTAFNSQTTLYWSITEYVPHYSAWYFNMGLGQQAAAGTNSLFLSAMAVRSGDVVVAPVPIPSALGLFGLGLVGFLVTRIQLASASGGWCRSVGSRDRGAADSVAVAA